MISDIFVSIIGSAYSLWNVPGAADEAASVFNEAASLCVQKKHEHHGSQFQILAASAEDHNVVSNKSFVSEDASPRQLRHMHSNSLREFSGNYNGVIASGGVTSQSLSSGPANNAFCNTPSPMASQV